MNDYFALVSDTLAYIQNKLPKIPPKVELPPAPPPPKEEAAPPPPPTPEVRSKKKTFELKPQLKAPSESRVGVRKVLKEIAPDLYVHDTVPSDHKARRVKEAWKEKRETPTFPILFQGAPYRSFVANIAKAIDLTYGTCRIVEVEPQKKWDLFLESENLKLILAPDALIFGTKELLSFYQETPQQKVRTLGNVPLLLLPDLSLYYKDPYLKRALWNVICNTINSLPSS